MPNIAWNRKVWDTSHEWGEDGDEWSGMAAFCHQAYPAWKAALVGEFLVPQVCGTTDVLEIAPGHGRFTEYIVGVSRTTTLVDLSPTCLEVCRNRFGDTADIQYVLTDGMSLPGVADASIDFIWSFDSFVHMEHEVIDAYLAEFARVLRPGGTFTIHHAGKRSWSLKMMPVTRRLGLPGRVVQRIAAQGRLRDEGCRANVSREDVASMTLARGMEIVAQRQCWGQNDEFNVAKFRDYITIGRQPLRR